MMNVKDTAANFVRYFAESSADSCIEMMADCPEYYKNFNDVKAVLFSAVQDNEELFQEVVDELNAAIWAEFKKIRINTVHASFNDDGFVDAKWMVNKHE